MKFRPWPQCYRRAGFAVTYGPGDDMIVLAAESPQERPGWIESLRGQARRLQGVQL